MRPTKKTTCSEQHVSTVLSQPCLLHLDTARRVYSPLSGLGPRAACFLSLRRRGATERQASRRVPWLEIGIKLKLHFYTHFLTRRLSQSLPLPFALFECRTRSPVSVLTTVAGGVDSDVGEIILPKYVK